MLQDKPTHLLSTLPAMWKPQGGSLCHIYTELRNGKSCHCSWLWSAAWRTCTWQRLMGTDYSVSVCNIYPSGQAWWCVLTHARPHTRARTHTHTAWPKDSFVRSGNECCNHITCNERCFWLLWWCHPMSGSMLIWVHLTVVNLKYTFKKGLDVDPKASLTSGAFIL